MHQHCPEPVIPGQVRGSRLGPPRSCDSRSSASAAVPSQPRGPRTLFSVGEELEDEDFLSAVEDAENWLSGVSPGMLVGHPRPVSSGPPEAVRGRTPRSPGLHPTVPLEASYLPAAGSCHAAPSVPSAIREPCCPRAAPRRPLQTPSNWMGGQWTAGAEVAREGLEQAELDKVLASPELKDQVPAKRARVSASHPVGTPPIQGPPGPAGPCRTPRPLLRPGAAWASATPQLLHATGGPSHRGPWNSAPRQPPQPPCAWAGSKLHPPGHRAPCACSPTTPGPGPVVSPGVPRSPAVSPVGTLGGPCSALQTPVVTNRLVQLVTATSRTPARAHVRRFPGPAGLLPQQHGGKNPEEIVVSTPQTPAHGALAKLRTEAIVTSSQTLVEEDFRCGPWLTMKTALGLDDGDHACFLHTCSVAMVLRKAALKQLPGNRVPTMAVMVKSLTRSSVDASVVLRDPTGEMQGTVHRALLEARQGELKPGAVLLLRQVGVFSPSLRNHYLNVTPSNLVHVYSPDSGDRGPPRPPQPIPEDPGRHLPDVTAQPGPEPETVWYPGAGVAPEEEAADADDLDGLLSELPEDFFHGGGSWARGEAGLP